MISRREAIKRAALASGIALTSPVLIAVLNGCKTEKKLNFQPQVLNEDQARLVGRLVDRILPPTDTPGATDVGVDQFIDTMLKDMFSEADRTAFLKQLDDFNLKDASFGSKKPEEQDVALNDLHQTYLADMESKSDTPNTLFPTLKGLTLFGYFTSEVVMTNQLNYHAVPGKYQGCIPSDGRLYVDNNV